eukprot:5343236-Amphidinium_carterae.1
MLALARSSNKHCFKRHPTAMAESMLAQTLCITPMLRLLEAQRACTTYHWHLNAVSMQSGQRTPLNVEKATHTSLWAKTRQALALGNAASSLMPTCGAI